MDIYTDSIRYAEQLLSPTTERWSRATFPESTRSVGSSLFGSRSVHEKSLVVDHGWRTLFAVESAQQSNYDLLIELNRGKDSLPDRLLCAAGSGSRLHGFKDRAWSALPGNIHLSVNLKPARKIGHFGAGFMALAAVSVIDAIDSIPGLENRAAIKWVNDVFIDGSKICGVLAYTQTLKDTVDTAVVGIGLNVETTPNVVPTPYVPQVASLRDFHPNVSQRTVFTELLRSLDHNYRSLLEGNYRSLLERYRERSLVIDRQVVIHPDDPSEKPRPLAEGRVIGLGDDLEIYIKGIHGPVTQGRLILPATDVEG
jgi:biotin-[acetyl-CoA-carboxylase] ligase BirA-like protein